LIIRKIKRSLGSQVEKWSWVTCHFFFFFFLQNLDYLIHIFVDVTSLF
jgi:hypothetical protein